MTEPQTRRQRPTLHFFNRVFPPHTAASALYLAELAERLSGYWNVEVICAVPASNEDTESTRRKGIEVHRYALGISFGDKIGPKLISYTWSLVTSVWHMLTRSRKDSIVVLWSDPPLLDVIGGLVCRSLGIPYLIVIQDYFVELLGQQPYVARYGLVGMISLLERISFCGAHRVICISEDTQNVLQEKGYSNISVITNWCVLRHTIRTMPDARFDRWNGSPQRDKLIVKYAGNTGFAFDIEAFERLVVELQESEDVFFVLQVSGRRRQQVEALALRYPNVLVQPPVARDALSRSLAECDVHLVLWPEEAYGVVFPSKLYSITASGMVAAISAPRRSEIHRLVDEIGFGVSAPAGDTEALAQKLVMLADLRHSDPEKFRKMQTSAVQWVDRYHTVEKAVTEYDKVLQTALSASGNT